MHRVISIALCLTWFGLAAQSGAAEPAYITVSVPSAAQIWFDDSKTTQDGPIRQFVSPALPVGRRYFYQVRAEWGQSGRVIKKTQRVPVRAGQRVLVQFPRDGGEVRVSLMDAETVRAYYYVPRAPAPGNPSPPMYVPSWRGAHRTPFGNPWAPDPSDPFRRNGQ